MQSLTYVFYSQVLQKMETIAGILVNGVLLPQLNYLERKQLPELAGVYIIYWQSEILYVGEALNINRRHIGNSHQVGWDTARMKIRERQQFVAYYLCNQPLNVGAWLKTYETKLIEILKPSLNKRVVKKGLLEVPSNFTVQLLMIEQTNEQVATI